MNLSEFYSVQNLSRLSKQQSRFDKIYNDKIFILDIEKKTFDYFIKICGTTNNVYTIKLSYLGYNKGQIRCDCPDGKKFNYNNVFCKHVCFLLFKVFKNIKENYQSTIFNILVFDDNQLNSINEFISNLNIVNCDGVNNELLEKYRNIKNIENIEIDNFTVKEIDTKDLCPICFDSYNDTNLNLYLKCPCCNKVFHKLCINIWLNNTVDKTCPYCRSIIWKKLNKGFLNYQNL